MPSSFVVVARRVPGIINVDRFMAAGSTGVTRVALSRKGFVVVTDVAAEAGVGVGVWVGVGVGIEIEVEAEVSDIVGSCV